MKLFSYFTMLPVIVFISTVTFAAALPAEPTVRIGLSTNARSVSLATSGEMTAKIADNPLQNLAVAAISVSARAYRPPEIPVYQIEIAGFETRETAAEAADQIRTETGENPLFEADVKTNGWKIRLEKQIPTLAEANDLRETLSEKGFDAAEIITTKIKQPSADALELSQNKSKSTPNNGVLTQQSNTGNANVDLTRNTAKTDDVVLDPNLREIIVRGGRSANFTFLKPVSFGSLNERNIPVKLNGKAYRGRIEVFINERGALTVVNVISLEDYIRGVVPNELSLPELEAQKAQAVAARTYALGNLNSFAKEGFDLLPTTRSQVYRGYSSETAMATRATLETAGIIATYRGKPINALYTSTCGGRTENSENIFDFNEPYLRGVECSLEGRQQFAPFLVKTSRPLPKVESDSRLELARTAALFAVNNFQFSTNRFSDNWFDDAPNQAELTNWLSSLSSRLNKPLPILSPNSAKPDELANILASMFYAPNFADTLMSEADVNYQLSFEDADKIPAGKRANVAILLRDGWLTLYPDVTLKPEKPFSRAKILQTIFDIYRKKKFFPPLQTGTTKPTVDGKLIIKSGKTDKILSVKSDAFLFRYFGDALFPVKEIALVGGENVAFHTNSSGEVDYLEVKPTATTATAEKTSQFTNWNVTLSASAVQSRLSRYARGFGALLDLRVANTGFSRRVTDLQIIGTTGTTDILRGKIRSALRLKEQLFVMNKRYDSSGRVTAYTFTGRGWGHGIGMCQVGAYGLAKMGLKYDKILKHYYTGIDLTKMY